MGLGKKTNYRKTSGPHGMAAKRAKRQAEALERNAKYAALSLHDKIVQQASFCGKQFQKLISQVEKDSDGCYTLANGDCVALECMHTKEKA